jgi:hypothetical protein
MQILGFGRTETSMEGVARGYPRKQRRGHRRLGNNIKFSNYFAAPV